MLIRSIRFKIILLYMLLLMVTLSMFSGLVYLRFKGVLYSDIDDLLSFRAEGVIDSIDTYWETEKIEAGEGGINTEVFSKANNINFAKIAQHWVEEKSSDPKLINIIVQIFDVNGNHIVSSRNVPEMGTLSKKVYSAILNKNQLLYTINITSIENKPSPFRVLTLPVIENGKVAYIVQVASPLNQTEQALNHLQVILFLLLPLTVFLTGVLGAFLTKMALRPIDQMIRTIRQISEENLKLRVQIPDTEDEIRKLADTFNNMLSKLDYAFTSQKQFIQDISHELKTPLTILKGELEVTLKRMRSPEEYQSILMSGLEEINKLSQLIENLLTLARFDSRQMKLEVEIFDLDTLITEVIDDMRILAQQKGIIIESILQDRVSVNADKKQIKRALINVLDNAIKYTLQNGTVVLKLSKENGFAKIKITDTGIGIPEAELSRIFERFYRGDKSHSSPGFGLGLSITKSIIEAHRGEIKVDSQLGKGAISIISLPVSPLH